VALDFLNKCTYFNKLPLRNISDIGKARKMSQMPGVPVVL